VNVRNQHSYINFVDLFSGFCVPVPLKNEKSSNIASIIESVIIKCFGVPKFFSSDNAANLQGSEIISVFKFYRILHHKTTAYSPTSHAVVENSNRYLTQLLRLYSDQYSASRVDILTLAAVTVNSLPRICLSNKSPFFMFHGKEPLDWKNSSDLKFLSISNMADDTMNNRNFARLISEFLYRYRIKHNEKCRQKAISIPKDSLVSIKNYAPGVHRKLKPIYVKQPQLVVAEYPNVIYTKDFNNKISRHSKSNVKLAGERSVKLFDKLPVRIKLLLGSPMSVMEWKNINKNSTEIPNYLENIELDFIDSKKERMPVLPNDTHLLERSFKDSEQVFEEEEDFTDILNNSTFQKLKFLHDNKLLLDDSVQLKDLDKKYPEVNDKKFPRILSGIDVSNIIPQNVRKRVVIDETKNTFQN
jgi:hypothetical protein